MAVGLDTILSRSTDILHAPVGDDRAVMMSVQAGQYFGLDAVGARVWELLESPKSISQLCAELCEEFEVEPQTCQAQILEFAADLVGQGIVHADPA